MKPSIPESLISMEIPGTNFKLGIITPKGVFLDHSLNLILEDVLEQLALKFQRLKEGTNKKANPNESTKDELFLEKVKEIVGKELSDSDFQIENLCKEIGFSKSQLYRKMKELTGMSANEFIRTMRLKRAARLLQNQELFISEVTYNVGFNDLQYFRKCFKKQYGLTPKEYVQQIKAFN